jgi:hypothetical protein
MSRYPIYVRIERCPRFLKWLMGAVALAYLVKCIGDLMHDAALVYAANIINAWDAAKATIIAFFS